jgi:NAD(P)H-hydrate epimerase
MIAYKQGLFTGVGPGMSGAVSLAQLNLPQQARDSEACIATLESWQERQNETRFNARMLDAHKGHFGHVMLVGGDLGFGGAIALAAGAALKSGAGLVSVVTRPEHVSSVLARHPEAMVHGVQSGQDLQTLIDRADVIVVGPGLGQTYWGEQLLQQVMAVYTPVLLDADALNILAKGRIKHNLPERISVITPHPGEAARLLNTTGQQVQENRFKAAKNLSKKLSSSVVLKGVGSLVCTREAEPEGSALKLHTLTSICQDGNAGMASGGMGDVLSGILGSLMAQSLNQNNSDEAFANESTFNQALHDVVVSGVCLHSAAADLAANDGHVGMLASDVVESIRFLLK